MGTKAVATWYPPRIWEGRRVFVIGGGPSLLDQDLTPIRDRPIIGINNAYQLGDWIDVVFWMDREWAEGRKEENYEGGHLWELRRIQHPGWWVTPCQAFKNYPDVKVLKVEHKKGIDTRPGYLSCWCHSGTGAINLAANLGAKRIVLLGFDCRYDLERGHNYHSDHLKNPPKDIYKRRFEPFLEYMREPLEEIGVEVVNATPGSELGVWPFTTLENEIKERDIA